MTKNKHFITILALMLCLSVFLFPAFVSANTNTPAILAWITGDTLHVEPQGGQSGVESIYINNVRVNYRVNGAFDVPAQSYAGTDEYIQIYAVDFAGNKSNTILIINPYYIGPVKAPPPSFPMPTPAPPPAQAAAQEPVTQNTPVPTPAQSESGVPNGDNPFTVEGTGTVQDNAHESDGKEFFTVTSVEGNEFFIIIDRQRIGNNVYLLNAVTENDLLALAKKNGGASESAVPTPSPAPPPAPSPAPEPTPGPQAATPAKSGFNTSSLLIIILAIGGAGGAGYYFKILKPKREASESEDDADDSDDDTGYPDGYDDYGETDSDE